MKTWTVPLSLHTHSSCSSGRKATPYISALSVPLLSSLTSLPVIESHIRTSVPRTEVVASSLPEVGIDNVVRAEVCAAMIETGCFDGGGGGFRGGAEEGGSRETGGGHGGRWISWTWPICRPGIASKVEYGAVAIASRPSVKERCDHLSEFKERNSDAACDSHLVGYQMCPIRCVLSPFHRSGRRQLAGVERQLATLFCRLSLLLSP